MLLVDDDEDDMNELRKRRIEMKEQTKLSTFELKD